MNRETIISSLTPAIPADLATELTDHFLKIRQDVSTKTLERSSPGKFVETFVKCAQHLDSGTNSTNPSVDHYLNTQIENKTSLPEGIRFSAGRVARSMYTLRNKRNIAHNAEIDPNEIDLRFLHNAAIWILAEIIRTCSSLSMDEAGNLIRYVSIPVDELVEEIDGQRIIHAKLSVKNEILVLLHSYYPNRVSLSQIDKTIISSSKKSIQSRLSELVYAKAIVGKSSEGYKLTQSGYSTALSVIQKAID
jgi:hypothetical protein